MSGNLYLMSDIHGYFIPFLQILKKIRFTDANRMVILGDLVAKGPDSLGLLCFVMEHKNILALRGNHEQRLLQYFGIDRAAGIPDSTMRPWVAGDGAGIIRQMNMLSETGRRKVLEFIETMPLWAAMEICGRKYVLIHGAPDDEMKKELLAVQKDPGGKRKTADYDVLINRYESLISASLENIRRHSQKRSGTESHLLTNSVTSLSGASSVFAAESPFPFSGAERHRETEVEWINDLLMNV